MDCELSVIIPTCGRREKLDTLISGIASTASDHEAFEVVVVVDGPDDRPLAAGARLPTGIRFTGLTGPHGGAAATRNHALRHARGRWVAFYDDDARVEPQTIPGHLAAIRRDPQARRAHLGRVDWPPELIDSPWRRLLAETSMLFFWDRMADGGAYGFRHFWTTNLSVRRDIVQAVGGFREEFPGALHEDIELGWRLERAYGLEVRVNTSIRCLHDHALDPRDYLLREHRSGSSARAAREINPEFHAAVWSWVGDPARALASLRRMLLPAVRRTLALLESWSIPSDRRPSRDELDATYLAHLPLKRMAFLHGYLDRPFDALWDELHDGSAP
jgi:GT2 family glycosyltransferase